MSLAPQVAQLRHVKTEEGDRSTVCFYETTTAQAIPHKRWNMNDGKYIDDFMEFTNVVFVDYQRAIGKVYDGKVIAGIFGKTMVVSFGEGDPYRHWQVLGGGYVEALFMNATIFPEADFPKVSREEILSKLYSFLDPTKLQKIAFLLGGGTFESVKAGKANIYGRSFDFGYMKEEVKSLALDFLAKYGELIKQSAAPQPQPTS